MDELGLRAQKMLTARGQGKGVSLLLSGRPTTTLDDEHPISRLFECEHTTSQDVGVTDTLAFLDVSVAGVDPQREDLCEWLTGALIKAWGQDHSEACGALAELEALGALSKVFPECAPVPRSRQTQTPDFEVPNHFAVEVYCPRESETNRAAVARELDSQHGMVKLAVSYPVTSSGGNSLRYAANKVIDRFLNAKRSSRQFRVGCPSVVYVNARHEWGLLARDLLPMRSVVDGDVQVVGTFGAWHAFYGRSGLKTMVSGPACMSFPQSLLGYEQKLEGLFRAEPGWSGALIAVRDGIVLFENPWATDPLADSTLRLLMRLYRFRPEYSWYRGSGAPSDLKAEVERTVAKLSWTFAVPPEV
jgi:hypothetical protein